MSWIEDNKGKGPWSFTPSRGKYVYNEGNLISRHINPIWASDFTGNPVTPTHYPGCGYWPKGASVKPRPSSCGGAYIGFTTQSMWINQEQTLEVVNPVEGEIYFWNVISGGGSLSLSSGLSVVYTAPVHNAQCVLNPEITLSIEDLVCDTLPIAVTEENFMYVYNVISACQDTDPLCDPPDNSCLPDWFCCWMGRYDCLGVQNSCARVSLYSTKEQCEAAPGDICVAGVYDLRGDFHKDRGCCPAALL